MAMGSWSVDVGDGDGVEIPWDFDQGLERESNDPKWCSPNPDRGLRPHHFRGTEETEEKKKGGTPQKQPVPILM